MHDTPTRSERFFYWLAGRARALLLLCFAGMAISAAFLPRLEKNTTADAFIDSEASFLKFREKVEETFGLRDSMVVAVAASGEGGVFTPAALALVADLTAKVQRLDNVDPERVVSLATENNIIGDEEGLIVESFFEENAAGFSAPVGSAERAREIREAIDAFPLLNGAIVAEDRSMTIIVAQLFDETKAETTYEVLLDLVAKTPKPDDVDVHVAGEGAVAGYLSTYIDRDAIRVNPLAGLITSIVLGFAFMSVRGVLLPNLIVLGAGLGTFGLMAFMSVDFYVITNGLVGNLIGISVADSIYVISAYYLARRAFPDLSNRALAAKALAEVWRPVALTSITTIAGFLALYATSSMPPIRYFGLFGAIGVAIAWIYTMVLMPACLALWPSRRLAHPFRLRADGKEHANLASGFMSFVGAGVLKGPRLVIALSVAAIAVGAYGSLKVQINEAQIENFKPSEPIYRADKAINAAMDGTYFLDVLVETSEPEALYRAEHLRRIEKLQAFIKTLPGVNGSVSIVDYAKQLNKSVNEGRSDAYTIPDDDLLISQLFFLYNASSDPTDFQEEVDPQFQRALIRANVSKSEYRNNREIVPALERYLSDEFNAAGIVGTATGRVVVDYYWLNGIAQTTGLSLIASFAAVMLVATIVFRSLIGGLIAMAPVAIAVLSVYAVMGYNGVWLGVGTSMFASIAIGLAVDFSIHALDKLRALVREGGFERANIQRLYPATGRALFFNFFSVALGFAVLLTSDVPPLVLFGLLVAIAISTAFIAAVTLVPALVILLKPRFLTRE